MKRNRFTKQVTAWLASAALLVSLAPFSAMGTQAVAAPASPEQPAVSIQGGETHWRTDGLIVAQASI